MGDMRINQNRETLRSQDVSSKGKQGFMKVSADVDSFIQAKFPQVSEWDVQKGREQLTAKWSTGRISPKSGDQEDSRQILFARHRMEETSQ